MEPLLKGPAGLDYLERAFAHRAGAPDEALTALPLAIRWLSSVLNTKDQEWNEHTNSLLELSRRQESSSQRLLPSTTLRTGGSISSAKLSGSQTMSSFAADPTGLDVDAFVVYYNISSCLKQEICIKMKGKFSTQVLLLFFLSRIRKSTSRMQGRKG